jgi:hypothetical protein
MLAHKDLRVRQDRKVSKASKVFRVLLARQVHKVYRDRLVRQDPKVFKV